MAFDFPASPTVGQTYTAGGVTYKWDGQAWMGGPNTSAGTKIAMLTTPPVAPAPGDVWWETDTGNLFIYYDDGNTQQWVQLNYTPPSYIDQYYARLTARQNILYNGAFQFSQKAAFATVSASASYFADGWILGVNAGAVTAQAIPGGGAQVQRGYGRSRHVVTTAKASLTTTDLWNLLHHIEGTDLLPAGWGAANAAPLLLRFGFRSSIAGTFSVSLQNINPTQNYVTSFTVAAGDVGVDKVYTLAIPAPTSGTWVAGATSTGILRIVLAAGPSMQIASSGWNTTANAYALTTQTNGLATVGNSFDLFDVRLIPDFDNLGATSDPGFPVPDYNTEFSRCCRYYQRQTTTMSFFQTSAGESQYRMVSFRTAMRATPTATQITAPTNTNVAGYTATPLGGGTDCAYLLTGNASNNVAVQASGAVFEFDAQMT